VWMRLPATTAFSFFQAEAGIRDFHVTGVQTCALPISDQGREVAEPVTKPGSVVDSHSSRAGVAAGLQQPTRVRHEPCHSTPIRRSEERRVGKEGRGRGGRRDEQTRKAKEALAERWRGD